MRTALALLLLPGCGPRSILETGPCEDHFDGPAMATCDVPGFDDRAYDLVLPDAYDGSTPVPVVLAIHGGGGNKETMPAMACPGGEDGPECLHALGQAEGFATVFPSGTGGRGLGKRFRTWNAGGGGGDWRCVSGRACQEDIDDVAYFEALLDDLAGRIVVDEDRVYATGISNGGAMSHRLACELSDRIAAIAPIGGAMQLTTSATCAPADPVAVMHIHGTDDPCWKYEGGEPDCPTGQKGLEHVPVSRTLSEWAEILGCDGDPTSEALPDATDDGTTTTRFTWPGCDAELVLMEVDGGGHTWPDGDPYLGERTVGRVWTDWGNEQIWAFLSRQTR